MITNGTRHSIPAFARPPNSITREYIHAYTYIYVCVFILLFPDPDVPQVHDSSHYEFLTLEVMRYFTGSSQPIFDNTILAAKLP